MKIRTEKVIDVSEWDALVEKTYERPYSFQQQDGCKDRGSFHFSVPSEEAFDYENDTVPEIVNHAEMGVSFSAWLKRNPKAPLKDEVYAEDRTDSFGIELWWHRNFYPSFDVVANDLHAKGLIEAGDYTIDIDW